MEQKDFHLFQTLNPHKAAVRTVDELDGALISGSIDKTCKLFKKIDGKYELQNEIDIFDDFIYAVVVRKFGKGFAVACKDQKIFLLDAAGSPTGVLSGHTGAVNALSESPSGSVLLSGSWDGTAIAWNCETQAIVHRLEEHSHAVCVLALDDDQFITGSQDKDIHIWSGGKKQKTLTAAHKDIIRELKRYGEVSFLSCSNDETVKMWSLDGELVNSYSGHTAFIFSICALADKGVFVSGSDDKTIKFWENDSCRQTINHPSTVWSVRADSAGDIVTGCADGFVRIFSIDASRKASEEEIEDFQKTSDLAHLQTSEGISEEELAKLPDVSELTTRKGRNDGDVSVFRNGKTPEAFVWKASENKWEKIGEVISQNPKSKYKGDRFFAAGEYDYVFDIQDDSGGSRLLPFNNDDNPLESAEKFLVREGMGKGYLEQICTFLRKNSKGKPAQSVQQTGSMEQQIEMQMEKQAQSHEEFKSNYFPMTQPILFETANFDGLTKKITESEINDTNLRLEEKEKKWFLNMIATLKNVALYHSSSFQDNEINVFTNKLLRWPNEVILPVVDLFRLLVLHPGSEKLFAGVDGGFGRVSYLCSIVSSGAGDVHKSLAVKVLCNLAKNHNSRYSLLTNLELVIESLSKLQLTSNSHKILKSSVATLVLNLSAIIKDSKAEDKSEQILNLAKNCIATEQDSDNLLKYLAAIGNLLVLVPNTRSNARASDLPAVLKSLEGNFTTPQLQECSNDVQKLLR